MANPTYTSDHTPNSNLTSCGRSPKLAPAEFRRQCYDVAPSPIQKYHHEVAFFGENVAVRFLSNDIPIPGQKSSKVSHHSEQIRIPAICVEVLAVALIVELPLRGPWRTGPLREMLPGCEKTDTEPS